MLPTPDIARLTPGAFLRGRVVRVWPFAAVSFLFAVIVLALPRTFDGTAVEWLHTLRPVNALLRELAIGALLLFGGVMLVLRRVPPGPMVARFTGTLAQAFVTFFFYLVALFAGLMLAWPLAVWLEAPIRNMQPALQGVLFGVLSVILVYLVFALVHRLGMGQWPGQSGSGGKLDSALRLDRLPDIAVRVAGVVMVIVFLVLFWMGTIL